MTKIEWTENTWNPMVGCSIVSPGCTNCYAMKMASRLEAMAGDGLDDNGYAVRGTGPLDHYRGLTRWTKAGPVWTGKLMMAPDHILTKPLRRKKPTTYFVNSMSDLFHENVPDEWIDRVFAVMALCPQHTFQVLTKRAARMRSHITDALDDRISEIWWQWHEDGTANLSSTQYVASGRGRTDMPWPYENVWLGVSAERQQEADERIPDLLATPAAVRFVSAEPLLGPIDFRQLGSYARQTDALTGVYHSQDGSSDRPHLDWIIVGGESGSNARPMNPEWARFIRDQCVSAGVPFFFKQWGEWVEWPDDKFDSLTAERLGSGRYGYFQQSSVDKKIHVRRIGKSNAGRLLDGREWNEIPLRKEGA